MQKTLNIWKITDGKQGHENQSNGLIAAIGKMCDVEESNVSVSELPNPAMMFLNWIFRKKPSIFPQNRPDLIIGAGHKTHAAILLAKSFCGGTTVVLMKPSLPLKRFDIVVVPKHDEVTTRKNTIEINGVLNDVEYVENKDMNKGLLLIGGESLHYIWDDKKVIEQIKQILQRDTNVQWTLTTSRRTPDTFLKLLNEIDVDVVPFEKTDAQWMRDKYKNTGQIWVTPDSVSMVYESLSSGAATYVFALEPSSTESRVRKGLKWLLEDGKVMPFDCWEQDTSSVHMPCRCDESTRVAELILEHLA